MSGRRRVGHGHGWSCLIVSWPGGYDRVWDVVHDLVTARMVWDHGRWGWRKCRVGARMSAGLGHLSRARVGVDRKVKSVGMSRRGRGVILRDHSGGCSDSLGRGNARFPSCHGQCVCWR